MSGRIPFMPAALDKARRLNLATARARPDALAVDKACAGLQSELKGYQGPLLCKVINALTSQSIDTYNLWRRIQAGRPAPGGPDALRKGGGL